MSAYDAKTEAAEVLQCMDKVYASVYGCKTTSGILALLLVAGSILNRTKHKSAYSELMVPLAFTTKLCTSLIPPDVMNEVRRGINTRADKERAKG
jgi:hypothetical protein